MSAWHLLLALYQEKLWALPAPSLIIAIFLQKLSEAFAVLPFLLCGAVPRRKAERNGMDGNAEFRVLRAGRHAGVRFRADRPVPGPAFARIPSLTA